MELARWLDHWSRHGFGYWTVCDLAGELTLGFGGLRRTDLDGEPVLNLHGAVRHDPGKLAPPAGAWKGEVWSVAGVGGGSGPWSGRHLRGRGAGRGDDG